MNLVITGIFVVLAAFILIAAVLVVTTPRIVPASLWLIAAFFGVAALYVLLEAEFTAVIQVLVYVGAVSILILFAIMLTRDIEGDSNEALYDRWWIALGVSAALFGLLIVPSMLTIKWPVVGRAVPNLPERIATAGEIGTAFMREYLLPFEAASLLLLVALIGAIVIAFEERSKRRRIPTLAEQVAQRRAESNAKEHTTGAPTDEETGGEPNQVAGA